MKHGQEAPETTGGVDAFDSVMRKESGMHDSCKEKDDFPASHSAGAVRRPPPGSSGLPGIAAAAGLALLLSACGGGGADAPNAGATLGVSALSIQTEAAVTPAPVAEKTAPVAPKTPPPNPQARTPKTPPPVDLPPVVKVIPPQRQQSPAPPTDMSIVTDPSTIPFPSGSSAMDETVHMSTFGPWRDAAYQPGGSSAARNNGPKVVVRRRAKRSSKSLTFPAINPFPRLNFGIHEIDNLWLTYPADAGSSDLAVHIRTMALVDRGSRRAWVVLWRDAVERLGPYYAYHGFPAEDFFLTEAYLQAPGSAVQPAAQGSETSATWTGKVIAFDSAAESVLLRGDEIGGDAAVTVNFGNSPTVDVSLTDLRSARTVSGAPGAVETNGGISPHRYPNQSWTGLALAGGAFSDASGGRSIKGVFRNQGTTAGTNANTAGGIFDVTGTMKGGFVATFSSSQ